ncbi:MAG: DUF1295 domain-containing protein [Clostridia bacterium]|nr:DUF1295 domain-containing protein [Clostridia bacterium]
MNFKDRRGVGFAVIAAIYILATAGAIFLYRALPFSFWLNLLIADAAATVFVFIFSVILKNASVYDPYWSVQPPVILIACAFKAEMNAVRVLLLIAVCFWGVRLTANWAYTFHGLAHQDWRYTMLKEKTGKFYPVINFVGIHMVPTLVVYACILPAVFAFEYEAAWNAGSVVFFLLSLGAAIMQGIADIQMQRFRKRKSGGFIRDGLWKYSRHPNYLGEILMWWGVAGAVVSVMPSRWYLAVGALLNTLLFCFVSLPMAEKRQAKKDGFEKYKKQTRILLPIKK